MNISRRFFLKTVSAAPIGAAMIAAPTAAMIAGDAIQPLAPVAAAKIPHAWKWWASFDGGECFIENFPTKEAAEQYAANSGGGLIAECLQQDFNLRLDGDQIFDMLRDQNDEIIGEGDFIDATNAQVDELEASVNAVISAWADKHNLHGTAWQFAGTRNETKVEESEEAKERDRLFGERWRAKVA